MSKYIEEDRLYKDITRSIDYCEDILEIVERQPAADVVEVRHGMWKTVDKGHHFYDWKCSVCGGSGRADYLFCPNCGASMVNEDE